MNETLTPKPLTEEVERDNRKASREDDYAAIAAEIAETVTSGKARLCTIEPGKLTHWQSYIRYHLRKHGLKLVYRTHSETQVRAWAEKMPEKKDSPK